MKILLDKKYDWIFEIKVMLLDEKHDQTFEIKHDWTFRIKVEKVGEDESMTELLELSVARQKVQPALLKPIKSRICSSYAAATYCSRRMATLY
ncbi:hypothetical protein RclHR1_05260013 [Rhizophagus clarus]|uniref:Uncharacterized protein n=1 Tax=Rhizophagus clarus TaxID=94130 RepID=A0A2Z6RN49_9GLOM|nr:hypothetical protein RclHR1_05260013 [Rhizophagus clarus]